MTGGRGRGARRATVVVAALAVALLAWADGLGAQIRRGPPSREQMERRVQQRFQERVAQELGLDQEQRRTLAGVAGEFQAERRDLVRRELQLRRRLATTGTLLSDEQARAALAEMLEVQEAEASLLRREQARLLEFMSPGQVVRFFSLRGELAEQIRRLQGGGPGLGGGAGARGAPPGPLGRAPVAGT